MNNWIGPYSKQLWNYALNVLHNFFGLNINTNSFLLEKRQPSSPTTKEPHWLATNQLTWHGGAIRLVQYLSTFFWVSTAAAANFFFVEEGRRRWREKRQKTSLPTFNVIYFQNYSLFFFFEMKRRRNNISLLEPVWPDIFVFGHLFKACGIDFKPKLAHILGLFW